MCCASVTVGVSSIGRCVEAGDEVAVRGAGGGEVLVAFFELQAKVDDFVVRGRRCSLKVIDVGGGAESDCARLFRRVSWDRRFSSCWIRG